MDLEGASAEIEAHVIRVVKDMVWSAYYWGIRRCKESYWSEFKQITPGQLASLCHLHQLMQDVPYQYTLPQVIGRLADKGSDDIRTWLIEAFDFKEREIENFVQECQVGEMGRFFNAVDLNDNYDLLQTAASQQNSELADWLIQNGVDVNGKDDEGLTPLHVAASEGEVEKVKFLLAMGANCYALDDKKELPFDKALQCPFRAGEYFPAADLLLPHLFADKYLPFKTFTRLHQAASDGDVPRLKYLLGKVDNADIKDEEGATPLHVAAKRGNPDCVVLLIEHGADVSSRTKLDKTPLQLATENNYPKVIEMLASLTNDQYL